MKSTASFVTSEFKNPSGEIVFRVSGQLAGARVRKNFATRAEAQAERQVLEIARLQSEIGMRTAATRLSDDQLKQAEAAFHRLESRTRSLAFYLDYALANYRDPAMDVRWSRPRKSTSRCASRTISRATCRTASSLRFAASFAP
jgi:hypothetical protein